MVEGNLFMGELCYKCCMGRKVLETRMYCRVCRGFLIIFIFVGTSFFPGIAGSVRIPAVDMHQLTASGRSNEVLFDVLGDVCSVNFTQDTEVVHTHPDIEVDNIDIAEARATQLGNQITVSVQVAGAIENRGKIIDLYNEDNFSNLNFVEYDFFVSTNEDGYTLSYANYTGQISNGTDTINLTSADYSVVGDTLSIWFSIGSADEQYMSLSATSMFVKMNFSEEGEDETDFVYLTDLVPNPPLSIAETYVPEKGYTGQPIQFIVRETSLTGTHPFVYSWEFGDGGTSAEKKPLHVYSKAGVFTYNVTVTDAIGASDTISGVIHISQMKKAVLFGRYHLWFSDDQYTTVEAENLRMVSFHPVEFRHFIENELITFSNGYVGVLIGKNATQYLLGIFEVSVGTAPPQTPNIACTTDSMLDRITVVSADVHILWRNIAISLNPFGGTYQVFSANGTPIAPTNTTAAGDIEVLAGDYIQLSTCSGNIRVTLRYIPTNSLLGTWTVNV
jgi:PKD repeat protein